MAGKLLGRIIRRVWCKSAHAWRGWDMTEAEREQYANPSINTGSWMRQTCRWCKAAADRDWPRVNDDRTRERLLTENGAKQARAAGRDTRTGRISRVVSPGYSCCRACGTSWLFVEGHDTPYRDGSGCFPLCERCWEERTPEERLPFYADLIWSWDSADEELWTQVKTAVMEGK